MPAPLISLCSILFSTALTHNCSSWRLLCASDLTPGTLLHKVKGTRKKVIAGKNRS